MLGGRTNGHSGAALGGSMGMTRWVGAGLTWFGTKLAPPIVPPATEAQWQGVVGELNAAHTNLDNSRTAVGKAVDSLGASDLKPELLLLVEQVADIAVQT